MRGWVTKICTHKNFSLLLQVVPLNFLRLMDNPDFRAKASFGTYFFVILVPTEDVLYRVSP